MFLVDKASHNACVSVVRTTHIYGPGGCQSQWIESLIQTFSNEPQTLNNELAHIMLFLTLQHQQFIKIVTISSLCQTHHGNPHQYQLNLTSVPQSPIMSDLKL